MLDSSRSDDGVDLADDPADALLRRIAHTSADRWPACSAQNDPICEPVAHAATRAETESQALDPRPGRSDDTHMLDASATYALYQLALARRAEMQAALVRKAAASVRDLARRLWAGYRRHRDMRAMRDALGQLDDRTLRDLGFHRCEIASVAAEVTGAAERTRLLPRAPF